MDRQQVLIIDDEHPIVRVLSHNLRNLGYETIHADTAELGLERVRDGFEGVILLDLRLPDKDGLELVRPLTAECPNGRIIIITAYGSIDTAVDATKNGAFDFVSKGSGDFADRIRVTVKNAFRDLDMSSQLDYLKQQVSERFSFGAMVARSPQMKRVFEVLANLTESKVTVTIIGESGTGKELVARALHYTGPRRDQPFVAVNCAGIPDTLLESELFGHERGAFTGAVKSKKGKFEIAHGGTIFLDEIGEMPLHLQSKILRVLQERVVERVGSTQGRPVDVRVISATHRNIHEMVERGRFREDLYYRLAVFPVMLPPLRDRVGDVPLLAAHFLRKYAEEEGKEIHRISPAAMRCLETYTYPGNVRELENVISHAVVVAQGDQLTDSDLPPHVTAELRRLELGDTGGEGIRPLDKISIERAFELLFKRAEDLPELEEVELELIRRALRLHDGNIVQVARTLGMSRATIYRRLEKLGGKDAVV